ncbi:MAG: hypothetical protein HQ446_08700 [Polaromonas sp.]|nr:hypothetical protein [Polaromonas sp.]
MLNDDNPTQDISASRLMWVDTKRQSSSTQVIPAGLMPLKRLKPEVVLQFHVAAVLLGERPGSAVNLNNWLAETLQNMSPCTRRPIRFLEPELTLPLPLTAQPGFEPDETDPGKRRLQQPAWAI